jgi:hypothetical protein
VDAFYSSAMVGTENATTEPAKTSRAFAAWSALYNSFLKPDAM